MACWIHSLDLLLINQTKTRHELKRTSKSPVHVISPKNESVPPMFRPDRENQPMSVDLFEIMPRLLVLTTILRSLSYDLILFSTRCKLFLSSLLILSFSKPASHVLGYSRVRGASASSVLCGFLHVRLSYVEELSHIFCFVLEGCSFGLIILSAQDVKMMCRWDPT